MHILSKQWRVYSLLSRQWLWRSAKGVGIFPHQPRTFIKSDPLFSGCPNLFQLGFQTLFKYGCFGKEFLPADNCKSPVQRSIAMKNLYPMLQYVDSNSTGILEAILQQDRNVTRKLGSQTRGLQLYATPLSALNLKPCVIIYDGVCHLCNAGINWIIRKDKKKQISFCALQSRAAEPYLRLCGVTREDALRRFVFVEGPGIYYQASTAALKVASYLPFPYSTLSGLLVVPVSIRDAVYDYVAKRRYSWFGKSTECILPTDNVLERFVDKLEIQERMTHEQAEEENDK